VAYGTVTGSLGAGGYSVLLAYLFYILSDGGSGGTGVCRSVMID
jgi:hypothetical protein